MGECSESGYLAHRIRKRAKSDSDTSQLGTSLNTEADKNLENVTISLSHTVLQVFVRSQTIRLERAKQASAAAALGIHRQLKQKVS